MSALRLPCTAQVISRLHEHTGLLPGKGHKKLKNRPWWPLQLLIGSNRTCGPATMAEEKPDVSIAGQVRLLELTFQFVQSTALKAATLLRIPDILAEADGPLSCDEILHRISGVDEVRDGKKPSADFLGRILRVLVSAGVFSATPDPGDPDSSGGGRPALRYGLNNVSELLVTKSSTSLSPLILMQLDSHFLAPWQNLHRAVLTGEYAYSLTHGKNIWEHWAEEPAHQKLFDQAMQASSRVLLSSILNKCNSLFKDVKEVLTDVGGGLGTSLSVILPRFPHLRGINFDLPVVVASAPEIPGVQHVGGDVFESVPHSDAIFMKWILHDWDDEKCIHILKNCHKALPDDGKLIVMESILKPGSNGAQFKLAEEWDLVMIAHSQGGREREEWQWRHLFSEAGFTRVDILDTGHVLHVIQGRK